MTLPKPRQLPPHVGTRLLSFYGPVEDDAMWDFHQRMLNRMAVSGFKYGAVADCYPTKLHAIDQLKLYLQRYEETHNVDLLADVANFAGMEFEHPSFEDAYNEPTGTEGRILLDGTHDPNEMAGKRDEGEGDKPSPSTLT